jgi:hypothetical protein
VRHKNPAYPPSPVAVRVASARSLLVWNGSFHPLSADGDVDPFRNLTQRHHWTGSEGGRPRVGERPPSEGIPLALRLAQATDTSREAPLCLCRKKASKLLAPLVPQPMQGGQVHLEGMALA